MALFGLAVGWSTEVAAQQTRSPYQKLEILARALSHVEQAHVSDVDGDVLVYGAIRGMLKALDPHSAFLDPQAYRVLRSDAEGVYAGVGVEIEVHNGWLTVLTVFNGGPASRAGVQVGDRFLSIEGQPARDMPVDEAVARMRGAPGTRVQVSLRRTGRMDAVQAEMVRAVVDVPSLVSKVLGDGTVVIRLRMFQSDTGRALAEALDEVDHRLASRGGLQGLVLDLRDNPGGLVSAAVKVVDQFVLSGPIVSTRGRGGRQQTLHTASRGGTRARVPLVVLVNRFSASASEIVAGALQDTGRAVVVGTKTFGKGSVQSVIELPDGSAIKLTTALYYTPSGRSIQAEGISPDVWVPSLTVQHRERLRAARDADGENTLAGHLRAPDAHRVAAQRGGHALWNDPQAYTAHQILRALVASQRRP